MNKMKLTKRLFSIILSLSIFFILPTQEAGVLFNSNILQEAIEAPEKQVTLFFVGDIMLGRVVENFMELNGYNYPFIKTSNVIQSANVSIGNFEGIIPKKHRKTEPFSFRFSIKTEYLDVLKDVGFDVLSIANNHSYDFGSNGLQNTRNLCNEKNITCAGDPLEFNNNSFFIQKVENYTVGYVFLHTLYKKPDIDKIQLQIEKMKKQSDVLIVYIHWGTEYDLYHDKSQEQLARILIDSGVDAVIGHHPHVVQDIELYNGKPIFYSLGNYIFDQYFNNDVQEGIGVRMSINDKKITYEVVGFSSIHTKSQPQYMTDQETSVLFDRIFNEIKHTNGSFTVPLI